MIATARVRWIVTVAVCAAVGGIFSWQPLLVQLAVACLIWVGLEWIVFRYRIDSYLRLVRVRRAVTDRQGKARVLWVGRSVEVHTEVELPGRLGWAPAYADIRDLLPPSAELMEGGCATEILLGPGQMVTISQRLRPTTVGALHFPGLRVVLSDLHGLFQAERFISMPARFRVLPQPTGVGSAASVRKQSNQLPPPGMHIVSRAGVGSELLEIRDYVPGDAPRSIAWKVSARRDTLMSKQFESEVPVRCHLLVDMSPAIRLGYPGPCAANRFVSIAATIAQTLASHRDPVGLTLFDEERVSVTRPSANRQTVLRMLDQLAGAIDDPIPPVQIKSTALLRPAFDLARTCYPRELQRAEAMLYGFRILPRRANTRMRLQLAALLAGRHQLDPLALGELVHNDASLAHHLQVFLADHHVPYAGPVIDEQGNYVFNDAAKISRMAKLLTKAVAKGHDNELFVLMAGLLDAEYQLQPLMQAIKVAAARHHRVVILCAWPPETDPPHVQRPHVLDRMAALPSEVIAGAAHRQQRTTAFLHLRRELGKLRVPAVAATDAQATRLVVSQMELVRHGRIMP